MVVRQEFRVNNHISLKLEDTNPNSERFWTVIYVNEEQFMQCHFLLLQITPQDISSIKTVNSIDELAKRLDSHHEQNPGKLTAEEEFFGHCSNLQAWYEYGYDTNLLHRNIAFPLLKRLTEVGDVQARRVFKDEIAKRLSCGVDSVVIYLLEEGYIKYLSLEELEAIIFALDEKGKSVLEISILRVLRTSGAGHDLKERLFKLLTILNNELALKLEYVEYNDEKFFVDNNGMLKLHITKEDSKKIDNISDIIGLQKLVNLKELYLWNQRIKEIKGLENLRNLEILNLRGNQIEKISGLENLSDLKELILKRNNINKITSLEGLTKLEYLDLSNNEIEEIKGLDSLKNLKYLYLRSNKIKKIKGLDNLKELKRVVLAFNPIINKEYRNSKIEVEIIW